MLGRAAGALAQLGGSGGSATAYDSYGLAMRFHVTVPGLTDLGNWSGCHGLSVSITPDQLREGGQYAHPWLLPGDVAYGQVTLERAMQKRSSDQVREWLDGVLARWVNSHGTGEPYQGESITITLFDGRGAEPVASWELRNAVPTAWLGPTLSGHSADVALERLQFAHLGFLGVGPSGPETQKATLMKSEGESVSFSYNPTSMNIVRGTTFRSEGTIPAYLQQQVVDVETLSITVHDLRLEGAGQVAQVPKLFSWLQPKQAGSPSGSAAKGSSNVAEAQRLEFKMGVGIHYDVTLNRLDVKYTRFSPTGVPIRAEVNITLADAKQKTPRQNPTSGGPPGRRAHTVTEGENLPRIAQATYANPDAWRDIAAANAIDDPLRVRNGRVLLLPGEPG